MLRRLRWWCDNRALAPATTVFALGQKRQPVIQANSENSRHGSRLRVKIVRTDPLFPKTCPTTILFFGGGFAT